MARQDDSWRIEKLVPGGAGFLRAPDGVAAFADGALPGDVIRPIELERRPGHLRVVRFDLVEPSPQRTTAPCPVVDPCGGCNWMKLERTAQLGAKADLVRQALERTGGFRGGGAVRIESVGPDTGYRSRIRLHVDRAGRVGYHARGTNELVEIPACTVARPELNHALAELRRITEPLRRELAAFSEIELRHAPAGPSVLLVARLRSADRLPSKALLAALEAAFALHVVGHSPERSELFQRWPLGDAVELMAPPEAFTQVNWDVNRALVDAVVSGAKSRAARRFCDVYAGAGNFSLALLAAGLQGTSIEQHAAAVDAARHAARAARLDPSGFRAGDVARELDRLVRSRARFDVLILDPPRSGAKGVIDAVARLASPHVAAIGCDPVTLARDLKALCAAGYTLSEVTAYDMFPHTHHVETLAWLRRVAS